MAVGGVLLASSAGKALFDGCIYAAMHDVVPAEARATAVGLMTMIGFCGAGLTPIFVAQASATFGMATSMASMAVLYVLAVALLLTTRTSLRRTVIETRLGETRQREPSMTAHAPVFRADDASLTAAGIVLYGPVAAHRWRRRSPALRRASMRPTRTGPSTWPVRDGPGNRFVLAITPQIPAPALLPRACGSICRSRARRDASIDSIGLRIGRADPALRYLRNGYTSWDGSYFIELESARGVVTADTGALTGHAVTALVAAGWRRSSARLPAT